VQAPSVSPLRGTAQTPSVSPIRGTAQTPSLPPLRGTFWLLNTGCLLRVVLQSLTDVHPVFFRLVGISGVVELSALTLWSVHVVHLMRQRTAGGRVQAAMEPVR